MGRYFTIDELISRLDLEIINLSKNFQDYKIYSSETNRPGLQLSGYFPRFEPMRIQVIGNAEWQYLRDMTGRERRGSFLEFAKRDIPAIIVTSGNYIFDEVIDVCREYDRTLLRTNDTTGKCISDIYNYAADALAPKATLHGVLVEVFSEGVLIKGESGVGKSETGLDLVSRGHKLISDDIIEVTKLGNVLEGRSPDLTRYFMEIRGLGILNIEKLYGLNRVKENQHIDLVVVLEEWDECKEYDRLGLDENFREILGLKIPTVTVPMRPGRNTAMVIEVAARNQVQKKYGYNPATELDHRVLQKIQERSNMIDSIK